MSRLKQFKLPDLGEGLTEGEILSWLVAPGDEVRLNQPLVEVETAKAAVEVPSPYAGVVTELHYDAGATVDVGAPIVTFDTEPGGDPLPSTEERPGGSDQQVAANQAAGAAANPAESASAAVESALSSPRAEAVPAALVESPPDDAAVEPGLIGGPAPGGRTSVLVGYGPKSVTAKRRPRSSPTSAVPAAAEPAPEPARSPAATPTAAPEPAGSPAAAPAAIAVLAKPPVRKLARDLGVDLRSVSGTGDHGVITRADVEGAAAGPVDIPATAPAPSYAPTPEDRRVPIKGVRKHTAAAMVASAFTAPHVTEWITVDVTPMMEMRNRVAGLADFAGVKVSPLLFVAKALLLAVRRHPEVNASWDEAAQEIVVKGRVNLGIAAATPRGLIVPNIKDAGSLPLPELAAALADLTATAREGKTSPADMSGGSITITNVGVFGVDSGTPILNPGEAAILCFGAVRDTPWVHEGQIAVRQVTQLSLSFDHRLVDGQLGSQFLADIAAVLADPSLALAWG